MRHAVALFVAMLLLVSPGSGLGPQTAEPQPASATSGRPAPKLQLHGVPNFGQVTPTLYRGAQPAAQGFENLQKFGVQVVVNFRNEPKKIAAERQLVEQLGMRYISIPWRGRDDPSDKQVAEFLSFLEVSPDAKVFVHCRRGAERTGVMVAAFRVTRQGWTPSQALAEMETFGFRGFWFRHLKEYVRRLPERLPQTSIPTPAYTSRR